MGQHVGAAFVRTFYVTNGTGNMTFDRAQTFGITRQARKSIPTIGVVKDFLSYLELLIVPQLLPGSHQSISRLWIHV